MTAREAPSSVESRGVPAEAFEALAALQQLSLEAGLSESLKQLVFRIVNRSIAYCRYDRAALWGLSRRRPRLLGVSGGGDLNRQAPLVSEWRAAVETIADHGAAALIEPDARPGLPEVWRDLTRRTNGLSVVWLPIALDGRTVAGLWLERWGGSRFSQGDLKRLESLALAYGVAWRSVRRAGGGAWRALATRGRLIAAILIVALAAGLCFIQVPLRIVAPCEVVPKDPVAVTAPVTGVIDEVPVLPGRVVAQGELLAVYDKRVSLEEIKVAEQQVQIIESDLQRARVQAFDDATARAQIALLENRLQQEMVRLRVAQHRVNQLEIRAPVAGTLMLDDPHEWRGRPVQVGQRIMMIVDPRHTKVRMRLPESDNIEFDHQRPLTVVLDSDPRAARPARLHYVANHCQTGSDGIPGFRAEADWIDQDQDMKMGLQGTAVLYGERVPLGYWLLRRPLAAARAYLGV